MSRVPYRSWIEVSRTAIESNFRAVRGLVGAGVETVPVVKADAYRHGAVEVARMLAGQGARWFAVSNVEEAVTLRQSGISARILIMADVLPFERQALIDFQLTPVIHSLEHLRQLDLAIPFHLKLDTGMSRLGVREDAEAIASALAACPGKLEGLMTHFASAGDYGNPQTEEQILRFDAISDGLRRLGIDPPYRHMASTIAIAYGRKDAWKNMVRPGHAIYGYVSPARGTGAPASLLQVAPALAWKATLLDIKEIPAGARAGYGGTFLAAAPLRIGIVAAGYADGVPHALSNKGRMIAAGKLVPVLGAVSMDLTTIDLTGAPRLRPGDAVTLIGREGDASQDAQQMARDARTISYSLLCGISARVHRIYVES
jgi:alanine racemase